MELSSLFQVLWRNKELDVVPKKVGGDWVYIVRFPDRTLTLMLTHVTKEKGGHFWTSVPEGRQAEAEKFRPMITEHYGQLAARDQK